MVFALPATLVIAQDVTRTEATQARADKLDRRIFKGGAWQLDWDVARTEARKQGRLIFAYFAHSPCGSCCDQLENQVLATKAFLAWSKEVVLFLHVRSGLPDDPYPDLVRSVDRRLASRYSGPEICFLDHDGNVLAVVEPRLGGYPGATRYSASDVSETWTKLVAWRQLRADLAGGARLHADLERRLLTIELDLGLRPHAELAARCNRLRFDGAERTQVEQALANVESMQILRSMPEDAGPRLLAMLRASRLPQNARRGEFWSALFQHAREQASVDLFEEILIRYEKQCLEPTGSGADLQQFLPVYRDELNEMKARAIK